MKNIFLNSMVCKSANPPCVVWAVSFMWLTSLFAIGWSMVMFCFLDDILVMTKLDLMNAIVLLSGLMMLPTNVHMLYSIANCRKMTTDTRVACCPLWVSIAWIVAINAVGAILCIQKLRTCQTIACFAMKKCMGGYRMNPDYKNFIDNIQWTLRCCGLNSYRDWFTYDWYDKTRDYEWDPYVTTRNSNAVSQKKTDSVPLSCCKSGSCITNFLSELGTRSINTGGCSEVVKRIVVATLVAHLVFFISVALTELLILRSIMKASQPPPCKKKPSNCESASYNVRQILKARENFDASSCSYQMHPDDSDVESSIQYEEMMGQNTGYGK